MRSLARGLEEAGARAAQAAAQAGMAYCAATGVLSPLPEGVGPGGGVGGGGGGAESVEALQVRGSGVVGDGAGGGSLGALGSWRALQTDAALDNVAGTRVRYSRCSNYSG